MFENKHMQWNLMASQKLDKCQVHVWAKQIPLFCDQ